jgi:hypothetical protein
MVEERKENTTINKRHLIEGKSLSVVLEEETSGLATAIRAPITSEFRNNNQKYIKSIIHVRRSTNKK